MRIDACFDSGAIEVVDASDPSDVRLRLRADPPTTTPAGVVRFAQWFHFRVSGARGVPLTLRILDLDQSAYPDGWPGYRAVVTTDRERFTRADTSFDGKILTIRHTPDGDAAWFSYFAPYDLERHARLVARAARVPGVRLAPVGLSCDGRALDRLVIPATGAGDRVVWVIARQHPGETMAEWWMEGFLGRLLDPDDALAARLRARATFHVIPHINPDGGFRGHLRTNAVGANLNREWATPTVERSPEVLHTLAAMAESGVDLFLDVHGDEGLPYCFIAGSEGIPGWTPKMAELQQQFFDAYERANPDFQQVHGYGADSPLAADMTVASNAVGQRFDCLSMTLEMPFKDNANRADPEAGWSPARSIRLGAAALDPFLAVLDGLR